MTMIDPIHSSYRDETITPHPCSESRCRRFGGKRISRELTEYELITRTSLTGERIQIEHSDATAKIFRGEWISRELTQRTGETESGEAAMAASV